jgi:hypothetical protein
MSREQVRIDVATVVQAIVTAWTDYPLVVEMDNQEAVDQSVQTNPYLQVQIMHLDADQADMSSNPFVKHNGQILFAVVSKAGTGTTDANKLLDFIRPYFSLKNIGITHCKAFEDNSGKPHNGWWYSPAIVNFWYHKVTT